MMAAGGGAVVNVSSIAGLGVRGSSIAYGASKGALNALTKGLAASLGRDGIQINAVCPGLILTPWMDRSAAPRTAATWRTSWSRWRRARRS